MMNETKRLTRRQYTTELNILCARLGTVNAEIEHLERVEEYSTLTEAAALRLDELYSTEYEIKCDIGRLERRWMRRDWTHADYAHAELVAANAD